MSGPLERLRPPLHVDAINEVLAGQDSMMAMILRNEGDGCSHIVAQMLSDDDAHDICEIVNTSADLHAQLTAATRRAEQAERMLAPFAEWADWFDSCEQHPHSCPDEALAGEVAEITVGDLRRARDALRAIKLAREKGVL